MPAQAGHNGFDPKVLKQFVGDVDRLKTEMESRRGEFMKYCRDQRELINGIFDRAKDAGVPKKELKAVIKVRDLTSKAEAAREDLEPEEQETFDQIAHALGMLSDLPLGEATLNKAAEREAAADSLVA